MGDSIRGFTLLEVLIATVIMTAGMLAIMWAFSAGIFAISDVENVEDTLNAGQLKMEEVFAELKDINFSVLTDQNVQDFEDRKSGTVSGYDVTVDLYEDDLDSGDLMQIDVKVEWDVKGGTAELILTTLAADY
ncbi:MAG: prepilin-type N-terminal cleavage/methylation domain-containing protein [Candidatus Omnitrophica bacterium]|nr:prepilin-type N-terminal cleavage/methylation domain-containing protein [Candidatus Omnitrophota bacterium]